MYARPGHQRSLVLHELQRIDYDMGGGVFVKTLQLKHELAGTVSFEPFVGDSRPTNVAAELLQSSC